MQHLEYDQGKIMTKETHEAVEAEADAEFIEPDPEP